MTKIFCFSPWILKYCGLTSIAGRGWGVGGERCNTVAKHVSWLVSWNFELPLPDKFHEKLNRFLLPRRSQRLQWWQKREFPCVTPLCETGLPRSCHATLCKPIRNRLRPCKQHFETSFNVSEWFSTFYVTQCNTCWDLFLQGRCT